MSFPFYQQLDQMDCGPTCLRMISKYYGKSYDLQYLREHSYVTKSGVSLLGISEAAEHIGFRTISAKIDFEKLKDEAPLPCIAHWNQNHFVVIYKIKGEQIYIADPGHGLVKLNKNDFLKSWISTGENEGVVMLLEPNNEFYDKEGVELKGNRGLYHILQYLKPYKKLIFQLFLGLMVASVFDLCMPFLTQSLVDYGINFQNLNFVNIVLASQLMIFFSKVVIDIIRSRILLHIGARINISIISDFLFKLMKLPLSFFDTKMIGDITQRINDHKRIESFLTATTLNTLFSTFNLLIFSIVLAFFSVNILFVFVIGSACSIIWIILFMRKRRELDYVSFNQLAENQSNIFELINGMPEIKLNNSERLKRWNWEKLQAKLFKIRLRTLSLAQYQQTGTLFFNQLKNILISFIAAKQVIGGEMTLGMMMAISYIVGQLNSPIEQLLDFMRSAQDAKISLDRLGEIHTLKDEVNEEQQVIKQIPAEHSVTISNLSFQYEGPQSPKVLDDISLNIPQGKVTAIVGTSGSGKTTLLKLLLKFYQPKQGDVRVGKVQLSSIDTGSWRSQVGTVMQDGFIFSDTITRNIVMGEETIDADRLINSTRIANIDGFIRSLPLGYTTKIGASGDGLSMGQIQRILIARAVYKNPSFLFFDEATSALDANNERVIMENLEEFFAGKTVIVIAHRLSTVKKADQIIVLENGKVAETGTHLELVSLKGKYFELVKNQLELGT